MITFHLIHGISQDGHLEPKAILIISINSECFETLIIGSKNIPRALPFINSVSHLFFSENLLFNLVT